MPRFTLSQHLGAPEGDHYDFFLQIESTLKSWRIGKMFFEVPQVALRTDVVSTITVVVVGEQ